jgi:rhodanese-related sulfurtransferase
LVAERHQGVEDRSRTLIRFAATSRRRLALIAAIALALGAAAWMSGAARQFDPANPRVTLADIEATVLRKYPVPEVTDKSLSELLGRADTLVFDVREPDEFAQSHLTGAQRIDPEMSAADFQATFGPQLEGRTVVFYCAVGVRSGRMLARVQPVLASQGAQAAFNLRGGIFRWHASGRPLVADGSAGSVPRTVHPYDAAWGALLDRTSPSPAKSAPQQ